MKYVSAKLWFLLSILKDAKYDEVEKELANVKNTAGILAFGQHLRQLREARGLSQQALADYADIAKPTIQRIEKGQAAATLEVLLSLTRALGLPFRELMDAPGIDS